MKLTIPILIVICFLVFEGYAIHPRQRKNEKPFLGEVILPPHSDVAMTVTEETIKVFSNVKGVKYTLAKLHEVRAQLGTKPNSFGSFDLKKLNCTMNQIIPKLTA